MPNRKPYQWFVSHYQKFQTLKSSLFLNLGVWVFGINGAYLSAYHIKYSYQSHLSADDTEHFNPLLVSRLQKKETFTSLFNSVTMNVVKSCVMSHLFGFIILCCLSSKGRSAVSQQQKKTASYYEQQLTFAVEISYANITANHKDWDTDMAIMFYAPWCKYCKQLSPSWEQIAASTSTTKDLVVGKFNCEKPAENNKFCLDIGVDRYPAVYFMGYGKLHQAPAKNPFATNPHPRIAKYVADLYPEAIFDWVRMCAQISTMQRHWDDLKGIFTGRSRSAKKVATLNAKVKALEKNMGVYAAALEVYKADELFGQLTDNGDPFPLLSSLEPDEKNLPFRVCVAEMASEYCKYHGKEEKYCATISQCRKEFMVPEVCRALVCPFENKKGCVVTSTCLQKDVIQQYQEALAPAKKASSSTSKLSV